MKDNVPSPSGSTDPRLLRLDPRDNVLCVARKLPAGTVLQFEGRTVTLARDFAHGDKLAGCPIATGTPVLKYGQPIGTATQDIGCGEWVHVHNLKSNYLPTYLHQTQDRFFHQPPDSESAKAQP